MSRPLPELETAVLENALLPQAQASLETAPARPTVNQVVENILRDVAADVNYVVDSIVPFGGE